MAFTPSNLSIATLGSLKLTIAQSDNGASGTDYWTSGITDIQAIVPCYITAAPTVTSETSFVVSWTPSSGAIHIIRDAGLSNTAFQLLVLSGFVSDMTW